MQMSVAIWTFFLLKSAIIGRRAAHALHRRSALRDNYRHPIVMAIHSPFFHVQTTGHKRTFIPDGPSPTGGTWLHLNRSNSITWRWNGLSSPSPLGGTWCPFQSFKFPLKSHRGDLAATRVPLVAVCTDNGRQFECRTDRSNYAIGCSTGNIFSLATFVSSQLDSFKSKGKVSQVPPGGLYFQTIKVTWILFGPFQ